MQKEELFDRSGPPSHLPKRPREGELSRSPLEAYVLDHLPSDLAAVAQGRSTYEHLAARQCALLRDVGGAHGPLTDDPASAAATQLDLLFMLNGYTPAGPAAFPRPLVEAISEQCTRFPALDPHMSYELLIDVNCALWESHGRMRVFTEGELGLLERDFYLGHHLAEPAARTAFERLCSVVLEPDAADTADCLEEALQALDDFRLHMAQYGRLTKEAFQAFRPYHMGYPGGPRGASGAFMPSVQLLELVLVAPTRQYGLYLDQCAAYFPTWSRPLISEWRQRSRQGTNVVQAVLDGRLTLDRRAGATLLGVIDKFVDFRMVHLGVTRKTLPEAFSPTDKPTRRNILAQAGELDILGGDEPGTSGFSVHNVLTNAVYRLLTTRRHIADVLGHLTD
ncbi:hypothetical protein [Streptomyces aquilus]|uniref:hypothetical protein n=1 Tax=Streptomyces aquilus TaxID=2548456 RepID=UPI003699C708